MKLEKGWENSKFKFKQLAGKIWILGTLGTQKKETEKYEIQVQTIGGKVMESGDARDVKKRDREDQRL